MQIIAFFYIKMIKIIIIKKSISQYEDLSLIGSSGIIEGVFTSGHISIGLLQYKLP